LSAARIANYRGEEVGIGGGMTNSVSLREYTAICRNVTGQTMDIGARAETAAVNIPFFVTEHARATAEFGWQPKRSPSDIAGDVCAWLRQGDNRLKQLFGA
jgi:CDP-paratose 2-epimerase